MKQYEALAANWKRKTKSVENKLAHKRQITENEINFIYNSSSISQAALDDLILNYIIEDIQRFSTTQKPSFKKLITR